MIRNTSLILKILPSFETSKQQQEGGLFLRKKEEGVKGIALLIV